MKQSKAFSLIELSIVVLVVGILIAGAIQGSSMIYAARLAAAKSLTKSSGIESIKDMTLWLDATRAYSDKSLINSSNSNAIENNDDIKSWKDVNPRAQTSITFSGSSSSMYPNYIENGLNNLPTIRFDGISNRIFADIKCGDVVKEDEATFFLVLTVRDVANGSRTLGLYGGSASPTNNSRISLSVGSTASLSWYSATDATFANNTLTPSSSFEDKTFVLSARRTSAGAMNIRHNSVTNTSTTGVTKKVSSSDSCPFYLGWNTTSASFNPDMDLSELIVYDRGLSDTDMKYVENYLSKKWAIQVTQ